MVLAPMVSINSSTYDYEIETNFVKSEPEYSVENSFRMAR